MSKKSYAEQIKNAQVMASGLANNTEKVSKRGVDSGFISLLTGNTASAVELNNEQERLKADLKSKTAELEAKLSEVAKSLSEARKIVKMDFPKDRWLEFGITDKA